MSFFAATAPDGRTTLTCRACKEASHPLSSPAVVAQWKRKHQSKHTPSTPSKETRRA